MGQVGAPELLLLKPLKTEREPKAGRWERVWHPRNKAQFPGRRPRAFERHTHRKKRKWSTGFRMRDEPGCAYNPRVVAHGSFMCSRLMWKLRLQACP